ncbi:MAG: hypothetical protein MUC36_03395 [Planctomycetes bacterium]|jgi:hypothetical protein|nr:hypothetical protein [Planctomycetota bacterium]
MTDPAIVMRKLAALRDHVERLRRRRPATAEALMELLGAPECGLVVDLTGPAATNTIEVVLQPRAPTHR